MHRSFTHFRGLLITLGLAIVQSCSHHPADLPTPTANVVSGVSISEAQAWYQETYPNSSEATSPNQASSVTASAATPTSAELLWNRALTVGSGSQQLVLVPLAGDEALFAHNAYAGPRYLIVAKQATNTLEGKIVEVLLRRTPQQHLDTLALFTSLYRSYQGGHLVAPTQGQGYVFLYSVNYQYLTGRRFEQGQLQSGAARLAFQSRGGTASVSSSKSIAVDGGATTNIAPPIGDTCIDWYDAETGKYITTTGNCSYGGGGNTGPPGGYAGGGGPSGGSSGPGGYGGGGGSGGSPTGTTSTQTVDSQLPPCANTVLNNLLASAMQSGSSKNLLDAVLTALQMPGAKMSVHFTSGNTLAANVAGNCAYNNLVSANTGINDFTIQLNTAYLNGGATDLFIAQTMLHETLHAALMDWALTHGSAINGVSFDGLLTNFMAMQGLTPGDGQGQHDAMSLLVNNLGASLYNYYLSTNHSGSLGALNWQNTSVQDCINLCWTGLENTIGYQWAASNDPTFKLRCDAIHGAELTGQFAATGSQANGTLQQRYPAGLDPCP